MQYYWYTNSRSLLLSWDVTMVSTRKVDRKVVICLYLLQPAVAVVVLSPTEQIWQEINSFLVFNLPKYDY